MENAQKTVESRNFQTRKHVLEYDDVMNIQREVIYAQRQKVLDGEDLKENIRTMLENVVSTTVSSALAQAGGKVTGEGLSMLAAQFEGVFCPKGAVSARREELLNKDSQQAAEILLAMAQDTYQAKETAYGEKIMRELERVVMLRVVDEYWMDNIDAMDDLKQGIGLRAYGQHDPVIAYKEEGYEMFQIGRASCRERV